MKLDSSFVTYQWWCGGPYVAHSIVPGATLLNGDPEQDAQSVLAKLPDGTETFLFHINCTLTSDFPRDRGALIAALERQNIRVLNGAVVDISKRVVQETCLRLSLPAVKTGPAGDAAELLIVKTNSNAAGDSEYQLSSDRRIQLGLPDPPAHVRYSQDYRVEARAAIPSGWWHDPALVIERFVGNPEGRWLRVYFFLNRMVVVELQSNDAIKKVGDSRVLTVTNCVKEASSWAANSPNNLPTQFLDDLGRFIDGFRIDFGTIDVMLSEVGIPYIIDVNSTPAYRHKVPGLVRFLRSAVKDQVLEGVAHDE